jgi:hypothetical protein
MDLLWRPIGVLVRFVFVIHPNRGKAGNPVKKLGTHEYIVLCKYIQLAARRRCSLKSLFSYAKANFKLIADFVIDSLDDLVYRRYRRVQRRLKELFERSTERRQRRSRSSPRQVKYSRKVYPSASLVPREAK